MNKMKIIGTSQVHNHKFKNLKRKILNCNANLFFNQKCLKHKITPKYANIQVPYTSEASVHTQRKVQVLRVKDEISIVSCVYDDNSQVIYN